MRKSTAQQYEALRRQEAADEKQANDLTSILSWADKTALAIAEQNDALVAAIRQTQQHHIDQPDQMRSRVQGMLAKLRGAPVTVEHQGGEPSNVATLEGKARTTKRAEA